MSSDKPKPYGFIYLVRNLQNGKIYIGQTRREVNRRWHQHASHAKKWVPGKPFMPICKAIRKYGRDNFTVHTIHTAYSREELDRLEAQEIARHNTLEREFGYNQKHGGLDGRLTDECIEKIGNTLRGRPLSPETRAKITAWAQSPEGRASGLKGRLTQPRSIPQDVRDKIGNHFKGKVNVNMAAAARIANIGRVVKPETREKLRQAFLGKPSPNKGRRHSEETRAAMSAAWERRKDKYGDSGFIRKRLFFK